MARLVFLTVPIGKRDAVVDVLDDEEIEYTLTEESSGRDYSCAVHFPLPTGAVEPVLDRLRDAGVNEQAVTVTVETESITSREYDRLEARFAEDAESPEQIARDELQSAAADLVPASIPVYAGMTIVSAIIATAGLLLDSAAVVVGSMVIAPLIGPAMATSVGTVFRDRDLFRDGVKLQLIGAALTIGGAAVFAVLIRAGNLVPPGLDLLSIAQIRERFRPDILSLVVALGSGAAGVISLASGLSSALVGVMIAVALVPPAATVGIGLAWGNTALAVGSGVLLLVNVLSINLAALVVLWYMGYRPEKWFHIEQTRKMFLKRVGVLLVSILLLSAFLGSVTFSSYQTSTVEQSIQDDVREILDAPAYSEFVLLEIQFEYADNLLAQTPSRVTILIGAPRGEAPPALGDEIDTRVDRIAGRNVAVQVRYLLVQEPG
ncbi:TIGR00341 family protein [Salinirubrum litoreum]|uniref:TIGR00341 family protein n=1 Tax=Salinirubrum litoreum TaxID=1126234 RepID=A0ABD5RBD0_9EURY|nr:TIGR00341 family protein [Salinirubrum litoreum]